MVGYNQDMLAQKARELGYAGDMTNFPAFLEQNPMLAQRYLKEQNQPRFQYGGLPQIPVGGAAIAQFPGGGVPSIDQKKSFIQAMGVPIGTLSNVDNVEVAYNKALESHNAYSNYFQQQAAAPAPAATPTTTAATTATPTTTAATTATPTTTAATTAAAPIAQAGNITDLTGQRVTDPALPFGTQFQAAFTPFEQAQNIDPATGQVTRDLTIEQAAQAPIAQTTVPTATQAAQVTTAQATPAVQQVGAQAQQLAAPTQTIEAAQQSQTQVANLQAAQQAQATQVQAPDDRALQAAEQISGPTQQAVQAAAFIEPSIQAAQANPSLAATVQGQLAILSEQFVQGEVPFWASGAVRAATEKLAARGLGASSIAGQAIVQAALEAAFPIAQADARTVASFEAQNLTNRQQSAMLTGQYRAQFLNQEFDQAFQTRVRNAATIADISNRNFTADQQVALENARFAQTVDLSNLTNDQALVMANAGALANLDISNLNNRQQAAVQNAQNFLQLDVGNLNNAQQVAILNSQQQVQSILTDAAAENASRKINATNQQQTDQFYANLIAAVGQQNTAQSNAINQFNTGEVNALQKFNSQLGNLRDQFNARNQLAIEQSNAVWRREIATSDTAALNFQNQFNAQNLLNLSNEAYDNIWQEYRDIVEFAFTGAENESDRLNLLQLAAINNKATFDLREFAEDRQDTRAIGSFLSDTFDPVVKTGTAKLVDFLFTNSGGSGSGGGGSGTSSPNIGNQFSQSGAALLTGAGQGGGFLSDVGDVISESAEGIADFTVNAFESIFG